MNDFEGLLANNYGMKPQGKSAPMSSSKATSNLNPTTSSNFDLGSRPSFRSSKTSNSFSGSFTDDHDSHHRSNSSQDNRDFSGFDDLLGGSTKFSVKSETRRGDSDVNFDSMFHGGSSNSGQPASNLPVYDKPVYDDDIFDGIPGLKTSSKVQYDDVFSSMSSPPKADTTAFDDLLGGFSKFDGVPKNTGRKSTQRKDKDVPAFDDLIPGFRGSSSPGDRIANMVRTTIMRLLYASCPLCPSHWITICHNLVLATSTRRNVEYNTNLENDPSNAVDGDVKVDIGEDDENMVTMHKRAPMQGHALESSSIIIKRDKHLRYRTRVFAAECLSHLPGAVGTDAAHFDPYLARNQLVKGPSSGDWLVLHVQELISLAYQISTIQFENMKPIGVGLLSLIIDKFGHVADPELPGHLLLEQYQAQLVSAVRSALDTSFGPILLEAGLLLATKILTSGIIDGDQVAVKRLFSLISRPLSDFKELYYPSFAEWVSCKIKVRLLAAHASLKCYTYALLRRHQNEIPHEYLALLPWFSKSSSMLGKYWIGVLMDYSHTCLLLHAKKNWNPFLDGIQSPLIILKLQPSLEESWPVILQAIALDAIPAKLDGISNSSINSASENTFISGYGMVELASNEYRFLWSFALFALFHGHHSLGKQKMPSTSAKASMVGDSSQEDSNSMEPKFYEIVLPVFQFLSTENFCSAGFLTVDICIELLQIFSYYTFLDISWNSLAVSVLSQIVQNCPESFLDTEGFAYLALELCSAFLFRMYQSLNIKSLDHPNWEDFISSLFITMKVLMKRFEFKKQLKSVLLAFISIGYKFLKDASTEFCLSKANDFITSSGRLLEELIQDKTKLGEDGILHIRILLGTCMNLVVDLCLTCIEGIHLLKSKSSNVDRLLQVKLAFSLKQIISLGNLAYVAESLKEDEKIERVCFSVLKNGTECIRKVLHDPNTKIQAIGLQLLKGMTQKYTNTKENYFFVFFVGELIGDVLTMIQKILKKPITKESIVIAVDCLRFLVLLQTLSNVGEFQKLFMNLLLEAVVMVFIESSGSCLQELDELKSTAIKLVSHLAQIPSSAIIFKDVILSMPVTHRQQLQGVIRASVTQDPRSTQIKLPTPSLEIKPPVAEVIRERISLPSTAEASTENISVNNSEEDEDDDDWDAFQSFPASTAEAITDNVPESCEIEGTKVLESNSPSVGLEDYPSLLINELKTDNVKHEETSEEATMSISVEGQESPNKDATNDRSEIQEVDDESRNADRLNREHEREIESFKVSESNPPTIGLEDSPFLINELKTDNVKHEETSEEATMSISMEGQESPDRDITNDWSAMQEVNDDVSRNADILNREHEENAVPGQELRPVIEQFSSQHHLAEDIDMSESVDDSMEDHNPVVENSENLTKQVSSDREILDKVAHSDSEKEYKEDDGRDTVVKTSSIDDHEGENHVL